MYQDRLVTIWGGIFFFLLILLCMAILYATLGSQLNIPFMNPGITSQPLTVNGTPVAAPARTMTATAASSRTPTGTVSTQGNAAPPGAPTSPDTISAAFVNGDEAIGKLESYVLEYSAVLSVGGTIVQTDSVQLVYQQNRTTSAERWIFSPPSKAWTRDVIHIGNRVWLGNGTGFTPAIPEQDIMNEEVYTRLRAAELWKSHQAQMLEKAPKYEGVDSVGTTPAYLFTISSTLQGKIWLDTTTLVPLKMDVSGTQANRTVHIQWLLKPGSVPIEPPR